MRSLIAFLLLSRLCAAQAPMPQHEHGNMPMPPQHQHPGMTMPMPAEDSASLVAQHTEFSSGTAWQPVDAPAFMWMTARGPWQLMAHGNLFLTFNDQGGPRGAGKLESMNWFMFMEERKLGGGRLVLREMFSADALTAPHGGFRQLFQTGETYHGRPNVDRQHPHDVFGELSALYAHPAGERAAWFIYGGPSAEPALGPVSFMHRDSASELPASPLSHHLQDSTHTSYGVLTGGFIVGSAKGQSGSGAALKLEASVFNGREPDDNRATLDFAPMDSWSVRAGVDVGSRWSAQYSAGHLVHPEALETGDVLRQTASLAYTRRFDFGHWCTTLVWGRNHKDFDGTSQNSLLGESTLNFARRDYAFTRMELVDKDELHVTPTPQSFRIGAFTFGGVRDLVQNAKWQVGLGADVTFYAKPAALDAAYGRNPVSFEVFLRLRPGEMRHSH